MRKLFRFGIVLIILTGIACKGKNTVDALAQVDRADANTSRQIDSALPTEKAGSKISPAAKTIKIPSNYPTIQAGLDAAKEGDTVLVAPGVYHENILFKANNKSVKLVSERGPEVTEIRGKKGVVVSTSSGARLTITTLLQGFKITGGTGGLDGEGGGLRLWGSDLTIRNNIFTGNTANEGAGLYLEKSNAVVENNLIYGNIAAGKDGNGGGIFCFADYGGPYVPIIRHNTIRDNSASAKNKIISGGGAIAIVKVNALIEHNLIFNNQADDGAGGISLFGQTWEKPIIRYNTLKNNGDIGINIRSKIDVKITNNNITGHKKYGVAYLFFVKKTIDAANNWWGDANGPCPPLSNSRGPCNPVSASVNYKPWLKQPWVFNTK